MSWLSEVFQKGGPFFIVNTFFLAIVIGLIVERAIYFLGRGHLNAKAFLEQLRKLLSANNVDRAKKLCDATTAPVARVAKAGLNRLHRGEAAVAQAMEETMTDTLPEVKTRIGALWSLANIATLVGLLGTITGLIRTFVVDRRREPGRAAQRSCRDGISEAMYNTAFGLSIALLCMVGHLLLSAAMKKVVSDLEAFSLRFENLLADGGVGRCRGRAPARPDRGRCESRPRDGALRTESSLEDARRGQAARGPDRAGGDRERRAQPDPLPRHGHEPDAVPAGLGVSAGIILTQIDTTLPDKAPPRRPTPRHAADQPRRPAAQARRLDHARTRCSCGRSRASRARCAQPKAVFPRTGHDGDSCDGPYMCETQLLRATTHKCGRRRAERRAARRRCSTTARSTTRCSRSRTATTPARSRKPDTYQIILMADGSIPYATIASTMAAMRCKLAEFGKEPEPCALPTEDPRLAQAARQEIAVSPDGKRARHRRAQLRPEEDGPVPDILFSSGFE